MFAADVDISKRFREFETRLAELEKEAVQLSLTFDRNGKFNDLLGERNAQLGSLKISEKTYVKSEHTILLGQRVQSSGEVNVRLGDDQRSPGISGIVVMPNGYVVMYDTKNDKLKLFDSFMAPIDSLHTSQIRNISRFDESCIIASVNSKKQLQKIEVDPRIKISHIYQLDKYCFGVAVYKDDIYVSCHNRPGLGEVRVLDKQGNTKRRLGVTESGSFLFIAPSYITVTGDKIFISDDYRNSVTCMLVDGTIIYKYVDEALKYPEGMFCDDNDNLLVTDRDSNNVQIIDAGGNKAGTIVSAADGLKKPCSVAFLRRVGKLVVGCYKMNNIFVYNLTK